MPEWSRREVAPHEHVAAIEEGHGLLVLARVSDADGDGAPEVLVGSAAVQQNRAHLLTAADFAAGSASESATFYGDTDFYGTGEFVGGVGDLDGDGYGDFGIYSYNGTSYRDTGAIHFFCGRADILEGALLTGEDARLEGEACEHSFGGANGLRHFHGAGDMDGDGNDDLVVGVPFYDFGTGRDQGAVYGILGRRLSGIQTADAVADFVLRGDRSYTGPGIGVARGGDRDGDGRDDLWLGANHIQTSDRGGTVYFFGSELVP